MTSLYRCAVVTGATSGLGLQLSLKLLPHVDHLIVVGRSEDKLSSLSSLLHERSPKESFSCTLVQYDFQEPLQGSNLYHALTQHRPEVLINNCGLGWYGMFGEEAFSHHEELLLVNLVRTMEITHLWLNHLPFEGNKKKVLCSIASLAGFIPMPGMAVYGASKSALISWMEALRSELAYSGVDIQALTVCPGSFQTAFQKKAAHRGDDLNQSIVETASFEAEKLAERIVKRIIKGKDGLYYPGKWAVERFLLRVLPGGIIKRAIFKRLLARLHGL